MAVTLRIVITNPQLTYTVGNVIRGQVVMQTTQDEAVGKVSINFEGRGKTKLIRSNGQSRRVYRGRAPLFRQQLVLYESHFTLKADQYAWDFEFTIPASSDPTLRQSFWEDDGGGVWMRTGVAHPLPPTFKYYHNHSRNRGMVEYKLEAEMLRHNPSIFSSKAEAELEIRYLPPPPVEEPDYKLYIRENEYQARTLHLIPDKAEKDLTFKEKMHSLFNRDQLPSATFKARLVYPTVTFPGRPIPLRLSIVSMEPSINIPAPTVYLTSLAVKVKSTFSFRAGGFWVPQGRVEADNFLINSLRNQPIVVPLKLSSNKQHQETQTSANLPVKETYLDLAALRNGGLLTPPISPSFKTINVSVTHMLKVKMRLSCAGKDFSFENSSTLVVLSGSAAVGTAAPGVLAVGAPGISNALQGPVSTPVEPQLPMYTRMVDPDTQLLDAAEGGPSGPPAYLSEQEKPNAS
jgi:hypothetical protein